MKRLVYAVLLVSCVICGLTGCTDGKEDDKQQAVTSISGTDKIPEEGIVDDMEDYLEIFDK